MKNTLLTVARHIVGVIMAAISTFVVTLMTGLGFSGEEAAEALGHIEALALMAVLAAFYAAYEKLLKPLFRRLFGEVPDFLDIENGSGGPTSGSGDSIDEEPTDDANAPEFRPSS